VQAKTSISSSQRRAAWIVLLLIVVSAIALVFIPAWLIQPFKPQSARGVALSYMMRSWSPVLTIAALLLAAFLVVWLWRGARRWWRKAILVVVLVPLLASTWFARQNHFEWIFNPLAKSSFAKVDQATFLTDDDVVLAVESNQEAVAYPIRYMAYHHVVQDVVGGKPIVATY
jgi:MFS family permease